MDSADETDMEYELKFRKYCQSRCRQSSLITDYYGTIETNKGTGHVFELVRDFDGKISETFEAIFLREMDSPEVVEIMTMFREKLLEEAMVTYTIFPDNFLIQRISEQEYRIRIIDGIGMHVLFPVPYFSKRLARRREIHIFNKFIKRLRDKYGWQGKV